MGSKAKKTLLTVGQILLFIVCFLLVKYIAIFSLPLDNSIIDIARLFLIFLFAIVFYCAVFIAIAFAVKKEDNVKQMLRKSLIDISQVYLFVFCMQLATCVAMWYVCKIRLKLERVEVIDSPAIGLIILPLAIVFYSITIAVMKLSVKTIKIIRK